jgi:hypothetical protein
MRKKKSNLEIEPKEKKSRAKYKCPDEVQDLIDKVNLVPFPINMLNLEFEITHRTRILKEKNQDVTSQMVSGRETLIDCLKDLPEDFQDYIKSYCYASHLFPIDISKVSVLEAHRMTQEYIVFYQLRGETIYYARRLKSEKEETSYPEVWDVFPISASGVIRKDENGNNYVEGLAGVIHKIIPDRFRMCEICNRIFWANYKNSFTCSMPCLNALRQRRHRKTNKEVINAKRRDNYRRNKKLKQLKEKKNGTL